MLTKGNKRLFFYITCPGKQRDFESHRRNFCVISLNISNGSSSFPNDLRLLVYYKMLLLYSVDKLQIFIFLMHPQSYISHVMKSSLIYI